MITVPSTTKTSVNLVTMVLIWSMELVLPILVIAATEPRSLELCARAMALTSARPAIQDTTSQATTACKTAVIVPTGPRWPTLNAPPIMRMSVNPVIPATIYPMVIA